MIKHRKDMDRYDVNDPAGIREAFLWTIKRNFINVSKRYLNIVEELRIEHDNFIKKLEKESSKDTLEKLDYFTNEKYNYIRKQILDVANDSFRDVENFAHMLEINFKKDKGNG